MLFFAADSAWAQMRPISPSAAPGERPRPVKIDQLHEETPRPALPFSISPEKRLDDDDLREKKTGSFLTGLPHFSSDPVEGLGFGVNAFLNSNGERNDPLFAYTPYRSRLATELSFTTKGQKLAEFEYDAPYIHNTPWRFRVNGGYEDDPNQLYFGNTAASMGGLSLNGQSYSNYDRYSQARDGTRTVNGETVTDSDYNTYRFREAQLGVSLERSFADGKLRAIGGFSASVVQTNTFDGESASVPAGQVTNGESLLSRDVANGVQGLGKAVIDTVRVGLVYDTRDLEPDPGRGIFAEITDEVSTKFLGSTYNFNKVYFQMKTFTSLFPDVFDDLVLAARAALGATIGNVAFYELQDGWSSEGDIEGLGGMRTLRGFKQSRFLAPIMGYANVELRYRFAELKFWGQRFKFKLAPFFDLGRVWDRVSQMGLKGFRADGGAGLRIAWNQSTIIMMDYAVSSEDHQFFLDFDHIF